MSTWTFDKLTDSVVAQFGCTQTRAADAVNNAHARMCADSRWRAAHKNLGSTTAGTSNYPLADETQELMAVRVENTDGSIILYDPVALEDMWSLDSDPSVVLTGTGGIFAPDFDSTGAAQIRLYPTPNRTGSSIVALEVIAPSDSAYGVSDNLVVPMDLRGYIKDGAFAELYAESDERMDTAAYHEQRFQQGTEMLRRRKNSRASAGPQFLKVARRPFRGR